MNNCILIRVIFRSRILRPSEIRTYKHCSARELLSSLGLPDDLETCVLKVVFDTDNYRNYGTKKLSRNEASLERNQKLRFKIKDIVFNKMCYILD